MKRFATLCSAALATLLATGPAMAEHDRYGYDARYDSRYDDRYDDRYYDDRYSDRYDDDYRYPSRDVQYDWGEVIRVDPIIASEFEPIRRDECWSQPVVYREPVRYYRHDRYRRHDRDDRAPAILGAIIGGVIGNQFGSGHGRDAATVAGAALGYSAVRDSQRGGYYVRGGRAYHTYEQRCATRTDYVRDERVRGYEVTYRYNGEVFRTTTNYNPGNRIRIRVDVTPID